jgi:hypothetical protein
VAAILATVPSFPTPHRGEASPSMLNSPKVPALRDSLARALKTSNDYPGDKTLRDEVCAIVDEMKAAGWPPERAIIAVKQIATEAGLKESRAVLALSNKQLDERDALMAKVVRWTIECYYDVLQPA